jgi:hypothetical protein
MRERIRRPTFGAVLFIWSVWMAGMPMVGSRDASAAQPATEPFSCQDLLALVEDAVDRAGVRDIQAERIAGYPHYRINRFISSFAGELADDAAREEWLTRLLALGNEARRIEMANLPEESFPKLPPEMAGKYLVVEMERCAARALVEDLGAPQRIKQLQELASVPDEYNTIVRTVGLNPVSSWFIMGEVEDLHNEARNGFQRPEAMNGGKIEWYVPRGPRPEISHEKLAAILKQARDNSALGIPEPDPETLIKLFDYYAPAWRISTNDDRDRIGRPFWQDDGSIGVDTSDTVAYRYHSFTRIGDKVLLQLNFMIWFPGRPSQGWFDILSGHLDGFIWRVTLDDQGLVLLYDSIHPCGCFHKYYPVSPRLQPLKEPHTSEPPLILSQNIPTNEKGRVVIHLNTPEKYVVGLSAQVEQVPDAIPYRFDHYTTLRSLPYRGGRRSMFNSEGVVIGTERAERWLVWPTSGLPYAGAMRQRGHYAVALIGHQYFDDARFFENVFQLKE